MKTVACLLFLLAGGGAVWLVPELYLLRKQLDLARYETSIVAGQLDYMILRNGELTKELREKAKSANTAQNPRSGGVARNLAQSTDPQPVPSMRKPEARLAPVPLDKAPASKTAPAPAATDAEPPAAMTAAVAKEAGSAEISAELDKPAGRRR